MHLIVILVDRYFVLSIIISLTRVTPANEFSVKYGLITQLQHRYINHPTTDLVNDSVFLHLPSRTVFSVRLITRRHPGLLSLPRMAFTPPPWVDTADRCARGRSVGLKQGSTLSRQKLLATRNKPLLFLRSQWFSVEVDTASLRGDQSGKAAENELLPS